MTIDSTAWFVAIEQQIDRAAKLLFTTGEFRLLVNKLVERADCPFEYLAIAIEQQPPFAKTEIVDTRLDSESEFAETSKPPLGDAGFASCHLGYKQRDGFNRDELVEAVRQIEQLVAAFWADEMRDTKSRIRANQNDNDGRRIQSTLERWIAEKKRIHFCFADLDRFKSVNDTHGMDEGDRVILEVAMLLQRVTANLGIPIHRSGDEFWIFIPDSNDEQSLELAREISVAISNFDFRLKNTPVGISFGIAEINSDLVQSGVADFEKLAEKAVKLPGGGKERGTARLRVESEADTKALSTNSKAESLCLAKANLCGALPFFSPWLNLITKTVESFLASKKGNLNDLNEEFSQLIQWTKPSFDHERAISSFCDYEAKPCFSGFDAIVAGACGIFRYAFLNDIEIEGTLQITRNGNFLELSVEGGQDVLLKVEGGDSAFATMNLGAILKAETFDEMENECDFRQAILVHVGHQVEPILKLLFADVISVDDRPTKGGELRDFWEATIARLIAGLNRCAATHSVFVVGDTRFAAETAKRLSSSEKWIYNPNAIAIKTGMSPESIVAAAEKIKANIKFVESNEQLIESLAALLREPRVLACGTSSVAGHLVSRLPVLTRKLNARPFQLSITDGCSVKTIAEAFPVATEILRTSETETVCDQAGMQLREVTDFKVKISEPSDHSLPLFYADESASFNDYANRAFIGDGSLFRNRLENQWISVKEQLCEVLHGYPDIVTTRRAILVVPYQPESPKDPLGLVCVRLSPRKVGSRIALDFSFIWRTVEALVGFPYSIFGSVRYADYLVNEVKSDLDPLVRPHLDLGELTYIAMSLHMFVDEYGQNIAKRIVDDASY